MIKRLNEEPIINEFESHQFSLYCWYEALSQRKIKKNSFLIFIDKHEDFADITKEFVKEFKSVDKNNLEELKKFIADRVPNSWFIKLGMEGGLIGDCLMITDGTDIIDDQCESKEGYRVYTDMNGKEHKIFWQTSTGNLEGHQGLLTDRHQVVSREINKSLQGCQSILLDIDLDYFSHTKGDFTLPIHPKFYQLFFNESELFKRLIASADVINFALEPTFCGGKHNMVEIKERLYQEMERVLNIKFF